MTRRRRILLGVAALAALAFALPYAVWHPRRLNQAGFEQIQNGMTQPEVEQLLGGPPGIYYPSYSGAGATTSLEAVAPPPGTVRGIEWYDHKVNYGVFFDAAGRVTAKHQRAIWYTTTYTSRHFGFLDHLLGR
jgi:hypothetical protein